MERLTPRDRALLIYVLWPALLVAAVLWIVSPRADRLAASRGENDRRRVDLQTTRSAVARRGEIEVEHARARAERDRLRRMVLSRETAGEAVASVQRLLQETGHTLRMVRVESIEQPRREGREGRDRQAAVVLASMPVEITATGTYPTVLALLHRWTLETVPLKISRVEVTRDERSGVLHVRLVARAFLSAGPTQGRP